MTTLIIFDAARLTVWGTGIMLIWLALGRTRDWITVRALLPSEGEVAMPLPREVVNDALLVGGMALLAFSVAIMQSYTAYLGAGRIPIISAASLWGLFWLEVRMLTRIAYHPHFMVRWALLWALFAHVVVIAPVLL